CSAYARSLFMRPIPRPSCRRYRNTPRPSLAMRARAACICSPQSQRWEWKTSPVRHSEWTRTRTGSPDATSPSVSATCSASVFPKRARYPWTAHSPYSAGSSARPARARAELADVPGLHQVGGPGVRVGQDVDRARAIRRADPRRHALARVDGHRERGPEARLVAGDHLREVELLEPLGRHRHADHPARVGADERDVVRVAELRGEGEVAFVLAVLVVDDDDHATGPDVGDGLVDGRERRRRRDDARPDGCLTGCPRHDSSLRQGLTKIRRTYF